jgi:hypothetical protein
MSIAAGLRYELPALTRPEVLKLIELRFIRVQVED